MCKSFQGFECFISILYIYDVGIVEIPKVRRLSILEYVLI